MRNARTCVQGFSCSAETCATFANLQYYGIQLYNISPLTPMYGLVENIASTLCGVGLFQLAAELRNATLFPFRQTFL